MNGITNLGKEIILQRAVHIINLLVRAIEAEAEEVQESEKIKARVRIKREETETLVLWQSTWLKPQKEPLKAKYMSPSNSYTLLVDLIVSAMN